MAGQGNQVRLGLTCDFAFHRRRFPFSAIYAFYTIGSIFFLNSVDSGKALDGIWQKIGSRFFLNSVDSLFCRAEQVCQLAWGVLLLTFAAAFE